MIQVPTRSGREQRITQNFSRNIQTFSQFSTTLETRSRFFPITVPLSPDYELTPPDLSIDLSPGLKTRLTKIGHGVMRLGIFMAVLGLFSSLSNAHSHLGGSWSHQGKAEHHLRLNNDGTATWSLKEAELQGTFHLSYQINYGTSPIQLNLAGFETGPLQGMILYGIAEIEEDGSLLLDWAPGPPDKPGVRPEFFGPSTLVFQR